MYEHLMQQNKFGYVLTCASPLQLSTVPWKGLRFYLDTFQMCWYNDSKGLLMAVLLS